ncbi:Membrane protein involved in the export of O-antigen and teichoic acid [Ruminococcaceae bacterium YRB3002]|nr:Membrane protein involved in the export of O-antigen and teichoic acid [Ruminococcaceae bacterium YRB3002]
MASNTRKIVGGLGWSFGERILAQGVSFLVSIILARILAPDEFGVISLILVFINIANVFVANGFGESLIQKKDADKTDFSTVFWCGFALSIILVLIIWVLAPFISAFYNKPELTMPMRILSLKLILASLNSIQQAYISKHLLFRKMFFATLIGTIISAFVGIGMAYEGLGVWALVAQYLTNSAIDTIALAFLVKWHPEMIFSSIAAKKLIGYSWKITGAALINELYTQIRSLIIGKVYSTADLAYYNKGNTFPQVIMTNINTAVNKVFFPVMSNYGNDREGLKQFTRKSLKGTALVTFPIIAFLIASADKVIPFLLTEKWSFSIPYLRILCLYWIVQPIQTTNWQVLKASGRSDLCLILEILKKTIGIILVACTMFISVRALAWSSVVFAGISMIINMIPNNTIIDYSVFEQFKDLFPIILMTVIATLCAWSVSFVPLYYLFSIMIELVVCFGMYMFMTYFYLKSQEPELLSTVVSKIKGLTKR